ncbi:MAG: hypothetical protein Kapaf2KO_05520 [Candidatus Kapaibacteriales bacterium]
MIRLFHVKFLAFLLLCIFAISCSSTKTINIDNYKGYSEINKGDSTTISWNFNNAEYVEFEGYPKYTNDSTVVSPKKDSEYSIIAYSKTDTLATTWKVTVNSPLISDKANDFTLEPSFTESRYYLGIDKNESSNRPNPEQIKIVGIEEGEEDVKVGFIVLDRFGNFIEKITDFNPSLKVSTNCETGLNELVSEEIRKSESNPDLRIVVDNSGNPKKVNSILKDFLSQNILPNLSVSIIDVNNSIICQDASKEDCIEQLDITSDVLKLNESVKTLFMQSITRDYKEESTDIVFLNLSEDNSSLVYTADDVRLAAIAEGIGITTVNVGSGAELTGSRYISNSTGGRQYLALDENESVDALTEIALSRVNKYEAVYKLSDYEKICGNGNLNFHLGYNREFENRDEFTEVYQRFDRKPKLSSKHQILTLFGKGTEDPIGEQVDSKIDTIVKILEDNPNYRIELIGHTGIEGSSERAESLSQRRAEKVASLLSDAGIAKDRVVVKAKGSSKPIYILETDDYEAAMNRRVEVRWLTPTSLPYEIYLSTFENENSAINEIEKWESKGYRVYYDRLLSENSPIYQVILWGYKDLDEAQRTAKQIESLYKISTEVN